MSESETSASPPPPPPQPQHHRRPRVREVSSRFMTPSGSRSRSSSSSPLPNHRQRSSSVERPASSASASSPSCFADENRNPSNRSSPQRRPNPNPNPPRAVTKLVFKETSNRPDTPTVPAHAPAASTPRVVTAASKLLHSSGLSPSVSISASDLQSKGEMHAIANRTTPRVVPSRYLGSLDSPCSRSLDLQRSTSDVSSLFHSLKVSEREQERRSNPVKLSGSGLPLPPPPPQAKVTASSCTLDGAKKAKKAPGHQEDVHSLKLLYNRYLQWRFVNAKAEASGRSQRQGAERALYAHGLKIEELLESVTKMRIQFLHLRKLTTLLNILEIQMPYLDQWSTFEEDYTTSLTEAIQALLNASIQIPISGNVRADVTEMQDALNSAMKFMDSIALNINFFLLKAEENEVLLSELARLAGGEIGLIEESGYLLSRVHKSQVVEFSLQSQLIQLHKGKQKNVK